MKALHLSMKPDIPKGRFSLPIHCYISENAAGRCHIFHQLIDICKDMADTVIQMDKSLTSTIKKYKKEKTLVSAKASSSLEYLNDAAKKIELNDTSLSAVDQTLQVVNQGTPFVTLKAHCRGADWVDKTIKKKRIWQG